jgi:hypothetical protein
MTLWLTPTASSRMRWGFVVSFTELHPEAGPALRRSGPAVSSIASYLVRVSALPVIIAVTFHVVAHGFAA